MWHSTHWCLVRLRVGPQQSRGGSQPAMRRVRCFLNSGWSDPWSQVTAWCPCPEKALPSPVRGRQLSLHNKAIHLCNEDLLPRTEKLAWRRVGGQMIALKVGVGVKVQRGGGGGFTKATDVILAELWLLFATCRGKEKKLDRNRKRMEDLIILEQQYR